MPSAPLVIDFASSFRDSDDGEVPHLVVIPSSAAGKQLDLATMSSQDLRLKIQRMTDFLQEDTPRFKDKGNKFRSSLARCQDELRRRRREKDNNTPLHKVCGAQEKSSPSHSQSKTKQLSHKYSDQNVVFKKTNASLSVRNFYGKGDVAFGSELNILGPDKCKTSEKGKKLPALRELPSRSFSNGGHRKEKDKEQKCSKKVCSGSSDRIRSRVNSSGFKDLSAHRFSKRKVSKTEDPLDSDSEKITEMVLLDDDDIETPEQTSKKELPEKGKENKIYYPSRNDPEAIELGYSDIKCLEPCEYLSSPVINFYIQYLKQSHCQTSSSMQNFYIFNTYFYKKLEEAFDGKDKQYSLFTKLRRWWKGVNIFEKAYIILPIHGSYLNKEWQHVAQNNSRSFLDRIKKEKVLVPQQKNEYDCGLFVLYFIERFIIDAPDRFTNDDLAMFSRKWFEPEEASSLRKRIRCLLFDELDIVQTELGTKDFADS